MKTKETYVSWDISYADEPFNDGYPFLSWQNPGSGGSSVWLINPPVEHLMYTISGSVIVSSSNIKESANYLSGVTVSLSTGQTTMTNRQGKYIFYDIPHGWEGTIYASKDGYIITPLEPILITPLEDDGVQNFHAEKSVFTISGSVKHSTGPLQGAHVAIKGQTTTTDKRGEYILQNIPYGWEGIVYAYKIGYSIIALEPLLITPLKENGVQNFQAIPLD